MWCLSLSPQDSALCRSIRGTAHHAAIPSQRSCKGTVTACQSYSSPAAVRFCLGDQNVPQRFQGCGRDRAGVLQYSRLSTAAVLGLIYQQTETLLPYRQEHLEEGRHSGSSTFSHLIFISLNPFSCAFAARCQTASRCCWSTNIHHPVAVCRALRNFVLFSVSFPS